MVCCDEFVYETNKIQINKNKIRNSILNWQDDPLAHDKFGDSRKHA